MKTSEKISLVGLAAAIGAVAIAASRDEDVHAAAKEAQINFGRWYKKTARSITKRLNEATQVKITRTKTTHAATVNHTGKPKN